MEERFIEKTRFDSWKEISLYLNRTIRTCYRWSNDLGLPVYRVDRMSKHSGDCQLDFVYIEKNGGLQREAANPPWSWNDHNDTSPIGEIATDPAGFIIRYAQGWGPVSTHYIFNPYQSI
jgi:hypothetical protein